MRITAGQFKGKTLEAPKGRDIRPTSDKVRQAVFNMLESRGAIVDALIMDAFCGSGALGLEALSRGAAQAIFIDKNSASLALTRRNAVNTGAQDSCDFIRADCTKIAARGSLPKIDVLFLDPPYGEGLCEAAYQALCEKGWLSKEALIVAESGKREMLSLPETELLTEKVYGDTKVGLYRRGP